MMTRDAMFQLATALAEKHHLDPALVKAVCHWESKNWNPWAMRYEPEFYDTYISPMKGIGATEMRARATSYGLMQVMGETARELGFKGEFLTELCDPQVGIEWGCVDLAREMDRANGNVRQALLGYNGGSDKSYPDKVLGLMFRYQLPASPHIS